MFQATKKAGSTVEVLSCRAGSVIVDFSVRGTAGTPERAINVALQKCLDEDNTVEGNFADELAVAIGRSKGHVALWRAKEMPKDWAAPSKTQPRDEETVAAQAKAAAEAVRQAGGSADEVGHPRPLGDVLAS